MFRQKYLLRLITTLELLAVIFQSSQLQVLFWVRESKKLMTMVLSLLLFRPAYQRSLIGFHLEVDCPPISILAHSEA